MADRQPATYHAVRLTGGNTTHAALLVPGWHGRALCGAQPSGRGLWEFGLAVGCRACLRRMQEAHAVRGPNAPTR